MARVQLSAHQNSYEGRLVGPGPNTIQRCCRRTTTTPVVAAGGAQLPWWL
jgi:hypothetical protein